MPKYVFAGFVLVAAVAATLFFTVGSQATGNLVGHWTFDDGTASDSSGSGNHGLVSGAVLDAGKVGLGALDFDGVDDFVDLGNLDPAGSAITLAAWINADNLANCSASDCRIASKASGTGEQDHYIMLSTISSGGGVKLRFRLKAGGTTSTLIASTGNLSDGQWTHVAATYDGANMRLFKDGTQVGVLAKTGTIDSAPAVPFWIGGNPDDATGRPWDGKIDDVRLYDRALDQFDIHVLLAISTGVFWSTGGNAGTEAGSHFLGTTDGEALVFKTHNEEAMRIDGQGRVGIGTSNPRQEPFGGLQLLDVSATGQETGIAIGPTTDDFGWLNIHGGTPGSFWHLSKRVSAEDDRLGLFYFDGTSYREVLDATTDGRIGIGTNDPRALLEVNGPPGSNGLWVRAGDIDGDVLFHVEDSDGSVQAIHVDASGRVGLHNPNPTRTLDLDGFFRQTNGHMLFKDGLENAVFVIQDGSPVGDTNNRFVFRSVPDLDAYDASQSTIDIMTIENTGHVGIGTPDPEAALDIKGEDTTIRLLGEPNGSVFLQLLEDPIAGIELQYDGSGGLGPDARGALHINDITNHEVMMTVRRDGAKGKVGIGTTVPESQLQVVGYTQLDLTTGAPPAADCDDASEHGRMKVDASAGVSLLYICTADGWVGK